MPEVQMKIPFFFLKENAVSYRGEWGDSKKKGIGAPTSNTSFSPHSKYEEISLLNDFYKIGCSGIREEL